jgi:hypothetical protein
MARAQGSGDHQEDERRDDPASKDPVPWRRHGVDTVAPACALGGGHFIRHHVEMLVAMLLGMAILGLPASMALDALGMSSSDHHDDAPALMLFGMAVTMTVPMVGWMRYRGHSWRATPR